jgi:hypothetical protein
MNDCRQGTRTTTMNKDLDPEDSSNRYDVKEATRKRKEREELVFTVKSFFTVMLAQPNKWFGKGLHFIKRAIGEINQNPVRFPPAAPLAGSTTGPTNNQQEDVQLSSGFACLLYNRKDLPSRAVIQITIGSSKNREIAIQGQKYYVRQWSFNAVDSKKDIITLKMDSTLNSQATLLEEGTIVKLKSFVPIYFNFDDKTSMECALLVKDFSVLGMKPVPSHLLGQPESRLSVSKTMNCPRNESDPVGPDSPVTESKDDEANIPAIKCNGQVCSNHGIQFVVCVTECIPVADVSLTAVAKECVFATKPVPDMNPKEKRFLLYYWYATSVYQFRGKGNQVNLPNCLVWAIHALYPEPNGNYSTRLEMTSNGI